MTNQIEKLTVNDTYKVLLNLAKTKQTVFYFDILDNFIEKQNKIPEGKEIAINLIENLTNTIRDKMLNENGVSSEHYKILEQTVKRGKSLIEQDNNLATEILDQNSSNKLKIKR